MVGLYSGDNLKMADHLVVTLMGKYCMVALQVSLDRAILVGIVMLMLGQSSQLVELYSGDGLEMEGHC